MRCWDLRLSEFGKVRSDQDDSQIVQGWQQTVESAFQQRREEALKEGLGERLQKWRKIVDYIARPRLAWPNCSWLVTQQVYFSWEMLRRSNNCKTPTTEILWCWNRWHQEAWAIRARQVVLVPKGSKIASFWAMRLNHFWSFVLRQLDI